MEWVELAAQGNHRSPAFPISELEGRSRIQFPYMFFAFYPCWGLSSLVPSSALSQHCSPQCHCLPWQICLHRNVASVTTHTQAEFLSVPIQSAPQEVSSAGFLLFD